ncbi:MAG: outer membrane protein assembly factor BamA [Planctomycetes bacterium]|nr:outer membrane protein assembly factor BamA [Planctomycetota bacterium]
MLACCAGAGAQGIDATNRPIADIHIEGLKQVPEQLVRNQVRLAKGDPYDAAVVSEDVIRITHLGRFSSVQARIEPTRDGGVVLTYVVVEQALLSDVQTVGNKVLTDQELLVLVVLKAGDPIDPFLIDRGKQEIKRAYEKKGYFVTDVAVDEEALSESNILLYRVREGPKPRIREIRFEGNTVFLDKQLRSKIKSNTKLIILRKGELSRDQLDTDASLVRDFYQQSGYLDAQVGRRIDLSPDQKEAVVVFVVQEGKRYTVHEIRVEGNKLFSEQQIVETMTLKVGDVFSQERLTKSRASLEDMYGKLGFVESRINIERLFLPEAPLVDVVVRVTEGGAYTVGKVSVSGNQLTKDKVILRQVRGVTPGRRYDREGIEKTERRLSESALFSEGKVTILGDKDDPVRDALVEVKEKNTGSLSFGAAVSSDSGVIGAIDLVQRNFDITDLPESPGEFFSGRAFKGAGQYFALSLQPGNTTSRYSVTFRDPYLMESNYFLDATAFYFSRERTNYDEERLGGHLGIGQRFGDVWSATVRGRAESIDISNVDNDAPPDVFDVEGKSFLTALSFIVSRNTTDSRVFPTRGSVAEAGFSRFGAFGGDYDFFAVTSEFHKFWTVDEDFFGRRTVLSMRLETGYIFDAQFDSGVDGHTINDAPVFERYYAGGHRSFRGFDFRGVGPINPNENPKGNTSNDVIGGDWLFLLGLEYNFPIFQDFVRGVVFTDTGTVQEDVGFDEYRVSIGAGIRIKIPFLGQAPFAIDFAYPIVKQADDDVQYVSFDLSVPF